MPEKNQEAGSFIGESIGRELKRIREDKNMGTTQLAQAAGISPSMLSRVEHGLTSPSISTLETLARALQIPVGDFFRKFDSIVGAEFTAAGAGTNISGIIECTERAMQLGRSPHGPISLDPIIFTLSRDTDVIPGFSKGVAFVYIIDGALRYSHGKDVFTMRTGDALLFDASTFHKITEVEVLPTKILLVGARLNSSFFDQ
jgi:transcriptional regulator with XRE-family HTH domain